MMDIESATPMSPHTVGTAYLNGAKVRVTFDTGAGSSIVGLRAAAKAGIKLDGPGVESAGNGSGIGRHEIQTWVANFPVLKIGDEEVHNARLRFGDLGDLDMLLGADFFLSHRIFVASSQGRVYFTYNGGPVFNLNGTRKTAQAQGAGPQPGESQPASDQTALAGETDATVVARRAAASAARRDFEHALEDYDEACKLAPNEAPYFLQRGILKVNSLHQFEQGASDIDRAIELKPDYEFLLSHMPGKEIADLREDLPRFRSTVVNQIVPVRLPLEHLQYGLHARLPHFSMHPHCIAEQQITRAARQDGRRKSVQVAVHRREERILQVVPGGVILSGRLTDPLARHQDIVHQFVGMEVSPTPVTSAIGVPEAITAGTGIPSCFARSTMASVSAPPADEPNIASSLGSMVRNKCLYTVMPSSSAAGKCASGGMR